MIKTLFVAFGMVMALVQSGAAEDIKIGVLLPLTGPSSDGGRDMQRGFEIATEMQNEKGGVNGDKIKLIMADAMDVKTGRSEAERLIQSEGAKIIMGTYVSAIAFAATEVAERAKTFYWEVNSVADAITQRGFKYTFRPSIKGSNVGEVGIDFIKGDLARNLNVEPSKLRLAVVYEDFDLRFDRSQGHRSIRKSGGYPGRRVGQLQPGFKRSFVGGPSGEGGTPGRAVSGVVHSRRNIVAATVEADGSAAESHLHLWRVQRPGNQGCARRRRK